MFSKTSHIDIIEQIAKGLKAAGMNKRYLELGIAKAKCFNRVAPYFKDACAVDMSEKSLCTIKDRIKYREFHGTTDGFFAFMEENITLDFNLIFIDANHDFENNVKKDFINSWNVLEDNGLIVLHDTCPPNEEYLDHCKDAYKIQSYINQQMTKDYYNPKYSEIKEYDCCDSITLPFYYGLTIVRKYKNHLAWQK